ncbi:hypothetical protein ACMA1D_02055 [Streptomyces sp. 796.1]|uniref:hypothetical protein n=1 Tax=Streptomyces sp. 796.1 TaxID=3163029 RepID=UPI0039C98068
MTDDEVWAALEQPGERAPLLTVGEARAVVGLLRQLAADDQAGPAAELVGRLARRLPSNQPR